MVLVARACAVSYVVHGTYRFGTILKISVCFHNMLVNVVCLLYVWQI